jgi:succinyl-CoA synthetase alpha subunit
LSILVDRKTRALVQGLGKQGSLQTRIMLEYGTKIVAGVTPGKGGTEVEGVPVYNTVKEAIAKHEVNFTIGFVPAPFAKEAALEALRNNLPHVCITEGVPVHDTIAFVQEAKRRKLACIGPNSPGICTPKRCKLGILPNDIFKKGKIGVVSRSGTLTYEVVSQLTQNRHGQSTVVGIGGDPIVGMDFSEVLKMFEEDRKTKKIVLSGEIGGNAEETAAEYIKEHVTKPVVAYIAGRTAPPGKAMGHAGAIIMGKAGTAETKIEALEKAGVTVVEFPDQIHEQL